MSRNLLLRTARFLVLVFWSIALVGCNGPLPERSATTNPDTGQTHPELGTAPPTGEPSPALLGLRDKALAAKKLHEKNRADLQAAKAYAAALVAFGDAIQNAPELPRNTKFRQALQMFRKAVELDPGNERAKELIALSEAIYRQMNRPVPPKEEPNFDLGT